MKIDIKEIEKYLNKWQSTLRLKDWDIKIHLVEKEWRKSGDIKIDDCNKQAILMINGKNPRMTNLEEVIIHELLHIKLRGMGELIKRLINSAYGTDETDVKRDFVYEDFMLTLESTTQDLTKGYVELGADNKDIPFGYLEDEVKEELK